MKLNFATLLLAAAALNAQPGPFNVGAYTLIQETRLDRTTFEYEYRITVANAGTLNAINISALATSNHPNITIVPAANTLNFPNINGGQSALSTNTFRFRFVRTVPFLPSMINWTFNSTVAAPTANAGQNQSVNLGQLVTLNASGSTDPNGLALTRQWSLTLPPSCSGINISSTTDVMPTFPANCVGNFSAQLIVRNSLNIASAPVSVTISTSAVAPTANAGSNQSLSLTQVNPTVFLNGSASTSPGNLPLTYTWSFLNRPANSAATLSNTGAVQPTFTADRIGLYRLQLIVNNGFLNSAPSTVDITTSNLKPTANPGNSQSATVNSLVNLNGSGSTDPNSLPLTYTWSLTTRPATSNAALSALNIVNPTFTLDINGTYVAQLIVCNPFQCSDPATVTISTQLLAPTARPGTPQTVNVGTPVNLSGLTSSDPQSLPLTYIWSFNSRPSGSAAAFTSTTSPTPSFTPDRFGDYVVQLTVSNGTLSSAPATVTISTNYVVPTANAGANQNATVNGTVNLSGLASQSFSGYGLSYTWSFNTRPSGSNATITNPSSPQPTFVPDLPGLYIVQLIVNDTIQNSTPATTQVSASFGNSITVTGPNSILSFDQPNGTVTLSNPAGNGGQTVNLSSSGTGTVSIPSSVVVPQNNTAANFPITGGTTAGPVTIQGSFSGFASGSLNTTVANRGMSLTTQQPIVAIGQTFSGTLTLNNPAPSAGATINLVSTNLSVFTVSTPTLTFTSGQTTANFNYTATGNGQANINASASGYISAAGIVTVSGSTILLPNNFPLGLTQTTAYPVSLSTGAPTGGTNINFTTQPGVIITPSSVFIAAGQTSPAVLPTITSNTLGTSTINASATGYAPASDFATITIGVSLNPGTVSVNVGQSSDVTVNLSAPAPAGGISLSITGNNAATATIASPLVIPVGQSQGTLTVNGIAQGSTTATISGANTNSPTLTINVSTPQPVTISGGTNLGRNAQEILTVSLGQNAPPSGLTAIVSTTSPNILLSTNPALQGTASISVNFTGNSQTSPLIYVQNVNASSGTGTVRFEASGYTTTNRVFTFFPSAFTLSQATINTTASAPALSLSINFNRLEATNLQQTMRGGYSESIVLTNSAPSVATVTTPLTFTGNQSGQTFSGALTPSAAGGQTNINITQPSGYTAPTPNDPTVVNVSNLTMSLVSLFSGQNVIGRNQQAEHFVQLSGPAAVLTPITLTAPSGTLLSTNPNTAGTSTLTVNVAATQTLSSSFFIQNVNQDSGTPSIALSSTNPLVGAGSGSVSYTRSGFYPYTSTATNFSMNLSQAPAPLQVWFARLDGSNARTADLPMRGGYSETITFATSPNGVVTLPASVIFNSSTSGSQTFNSAITPVSVNTTNITINQPTGYFANTNFTQVAVTVSNNQILFSSIPSSLGYDQVACGTLSLNPGAPAGGLSLQVSSPGNLSFSAASNIVGQNPLTVNFTVGASSTPLCVHNIATSTGSATVNVTVLTAGANYSATPANVALWPSGFYPWTPNIALNTLNASGADLQVWFARINPANGAYAGDLPLRPGAGSRTITLNNSNPASVSLPDSVVFSDDGTSTVRTYTGIVDNASPAIPGTSSITVSQPAGHTANITYTTSVVTVSAPTISISCFSTVGLNLQVQCSATPSQALPSNLIANLSSSNPNLLVSVVRTAVGSQTITPSLNAGTGSLNFYAQALASSGSATVSLAIPGYTTGTVNLTLSNSGFYTYPGATINVGQSAQVQVYAAVLGAAPNYPRLAELEVRGGTSVTLTMSSSNPGIHSALPTVTFATTPANTTGNLITFNVTGVSPGSTSITAIQPSGSQQTTTYSYILNVN